MKGFCCAKFYVLMKRYAGIFLCGGMIINVIDELNESMLKTTNRKVNNKFYKNGSNLKKYIINTKHCKVY